MEIPKTGICMWPAKLQGSSSSNWRHMPWHMQHFWWTHDSHVKNWIGRGLFHLIFLKLGNWMLVKRRLPTHRINKPWVTTNVNVVSKTNVIWRRIVWHCTNSYNQCHRSTWIIPPICCKWIYHIWQDWRMFIRPETSRKQPGGASVIASSRCESEKIHSMLKQHSSCLVVSIPLKNIS